MRNHAVLQIIPTFLLRLRQKCVKYLERRCPGRDFAAARLKLFYSQPCLLRAALLTLQLNPPGLRSSGCPTAEGRRQRSSRQPHSGLPEDVHFDLFDRHQISVSVSWSGCRVTGQSVDESRLILLVQAVGLKLSDPDVEEFMALGLQETNI